MVVSVGGTYSDTTLALFGLDGTHTSAKVPGYDTRLLSASTLEYYLVSWSLPLWEMVGY